MRKKLSQYALLVVVLVFFANLLAYKFYWYNSIWWYDMFMHTMGGIFLAVLAGIAFVKTYEGQIRQEIIVSTLLFVLTVGLGWELFEYAVQILLKPEPFVNISDSVSDLICDMTGGIIGTYFVLKAKKRYNTTHGKIENA